MPQGTEAALLSRFYWSSLVSETFNVIQPFQFIFLVLVLDEPAWAPIPLLIESVIVFLCEIPTGIIADKFGRKFSCLLGDTLSGIGWLIVPVITILDGYTQLIVVCLIFGLEGLGQTLVSGAEEAWVWDNLVAKKQLNLAEQFFAREKSLSSLGGIFSATVIWILLLTAPVSTELINGLWLISGVGQIASVIILLKMPEYTLSESNRDKFEQDNVFLQNKGAFRAGLLAILRIKPLFAFTAVLLIITFVTSITGDAFELSMIIRGLNPRELAPLAILTDIIGFIAPLFVVSLVRSYGAPNVLTALIIIPVFAFSAFYLAPPLLFVVGLFLLANLLDDIWDPIADSMLHSFIPSSLRATIGSTINQFSELVSIGGIGIFTIMLGQQGEILQEAIPSLVEAFAGTEKVELPPGEGIFGLFAAEAALLLFSAIGLIAAVILKMFPWQTSSETISFDSPQDLGLTENKEEQNMLIKTANKSLTEKKINSSDIDGKLTPQLKRQLIKTKNKLDELLDFYNEGEELSWWVSEKPFVIPDHTTNKLKEIGPALVEFFKVANTICEQYDWVRDRLQKSFTPSYRWLNSSHRKAHPRLIRPDVVCDSNWNPKLVELEITVGARADTTIMANYYKLPNQGGLLEAYAKMANDYAKKGQNIALITAPHPFFEDLPDDAKSFAAQLKEFGVKNMIVLTEENLPLLKFDGKTLYLCERSGKKTDIHVIDRFIDIYEIAELQHPGMGALLDAYLSHAIEDINTCRQILDEKDWLSLFWEPSLAKQWATLLGAKNHGILKEAIPKTWLITPDLKLKVGNNKTIPIDEISDIPSHLRRFVIKESGTSTTASGAQSFYALPKMDGEDIADLIDSIFSSKVEHVIQELIESPRIPFTAIDPETDDIHYQPDARFKLSPFYLDGNITDIRFIASNRQYAVNNADCVVSVVRR